MSTMTDRNRGTRGPTRIEDIWQARQSFELADLDARLGAVLIDALILLPVLWVAALVVPWHPLKGGLVFAAPNYLTSLANAVLGYAVYMLINMVPLARRGQTVGKMLTKVRIALPDGTPASAGRILGLRYGVGALLAAIPLLGGLYNMLDALLIFSGSRRCAHDRIAGTIVTKA